MNGLAAERLVTVCSSCLQATCWQGLFYCDDYQTAGTKDMPISELQKLKLEHPSYWDPGYKLPPSPLPLSGLEKDK